MALVREAGGALRTTTRRAPWRSARAPDGKRSWRAAAPDDDRLITLNADSRGTLVTVAPGGGRTNRVSVAKPEEQPPSAPLSASASSADLRTLYGHRPERS
jgi:hypothetical protein